MGYDIAEDPYVDSRTDILHNKIGAKTQAQLDRDEAQITYVIIATLTRGSRVDTLIFNSQLLCDIHKEIFRDIYKWAGEVRTHDIGKDWAYFAHAEYIPQEMCRLSDELMQDTVIGGGIRQDVVARLTYYYSEYNAIHPFREGNGRAIRTFLRLLALKHGYDIEWAQMNADENIRASEQALKGDTEAMRTMLDRLIVTIDE